MHYPDLSPYEYSLPSKLENVLNVGWLDRSGDYPQGKTPDIVVEKLTYLMEHKQDVNKMRGVEDCALCKSSAGWIYLDTPSGECLLGMSELWIPGKDGQIFAAPSLIIHYITEHHYQPPQVYIDAATEFDPDSGWSAPVEFERIMKQLRGK